MKQNDQRFTGVRRILKLLATRSRESRPEAEFLGYEAYLPLPATGSRENRLAAPLSALKRAA